MKLHCLGTAGYHPNNHRHTSCYAIPECQLLLDAGSGLFRIGEFIQNESIHVLLSHAHLDHVFGLTFFLDFLATTKLRYVHVYAEIEKIHAIRQHLFHPLLFPIEPPIQWHALEELGPEFDIEDTRVRWFRLEHPGGAIGFRLNWQTTSLAYITDTTCTPDAQYWNEIQGVDWLLHECNFSDKYESLAIKTGHSCTSAVLAAAHRAKISRLILTHFNPLELGHDPIGLQEATAYQLRETPEQIILTTDGLIVDLTRL